MNNEGGLSKKQEDEVKNIAMSLLNNFKESLATELKQLTEVLSDPGIQQYLKSKKSQGPAAELIAEFKSGKIDVSKTHHGPAHKEKQPHKTEAKTSPKSLPGKKGKEGEKSPVQKTGEEEAQITHEGKQPEVQKEDESHGEVGKEKIMETEHKGEKKKGETGGKGRKIVAKSPEPIKTKTSREPKRNLSSTENVQGAINVVKQKVKDIKKGLVTNERKRSGITGKKSPKAEKPETAKKSEATVGTGKKGEEAKPAIESKESGRKDEPSKKKEEVSKAGEKEEPHKKEEMHKEKEELLKKEEALKKKELAKKEEIPKHEEPGNESNKKTRNSQS